MAYTQKLPTNPTLAGTAVVFTAPPGVGAGNGDAVLPGSVLLVNNASGSAVTVTLNIPQTYLGYTLTAPVVSVPATSIMAIGPIPGTPFDRIGTGTDDGFVHVDYSSVTSVTRAVVQTLS